MSEVIKKFYFDEAEQKVTIAYVQDVTDVIDNNKRLQAEQQTGESFRHIATIPPGVELVWLAEEWNRGNPIRYNTREWWELVDRKLEDPQWKYLRTDGPTFRVGWGT